MYTPVGAEFSGFVVATNTTSYMINVDPDTGFGETHAFVEIYPGGGSNDPEPGPVCVPISGGWEPQPDQNVSSPGSSWRVWPESSSARSQHPSKPPSFWTISLRIQYQHGPSGTPPTYYSGVVEGSAMFAVYGGIRPDSRGYVGGFAPPYQ